MSSFLAATVAGDRRSDSGSREALILVGEGSALGVPSLILYRVTGWSEEERALAYGLVAEAGAVEELFRKWYYDGLVLPSSLAGNQPNDSLLEMTVLGGEGTGVFRSRRTYDNVFLARDTLEEELGSLVVQAGIRPDAAETLIFEPKLSDFADSEGTPFGLRCWCRRS